ncbi:MAG TPA: UDP-N-acetylmuramoyl-L-alanine--D-glutamate ligase [Thermoanaerobaculia bacterium]|nr:UDP-N-acetylmuramoyl-L-alanine--D-glutamate ligase [Thermoanaerobaculia bacterium]
MTLSLGPDLPEIRSAAVFGLARSGRAAVAALAERGVEVTGTDAKADLEGLAERPGVRYVLGGHPESLLDGIDLVVVSPGIPLTLPVFDAARARALPVVAEIELASRLLPGVVVGVTGTNGKSTTTALAAALLKSAGHYAVACGNFGTPWIHSATKEGANGNGTAPRTWVVELSSFQLEGIRRFAPDVAVHLNLTPDHLDRYRSMDDYGAAKARIFENQREAQVAVLNADDPLVARIRPRARRLAFSRHHSPGMGAWLADDLFLADVTGKGPRIVAKRSDLALPGAHNVENALAALAATLPLGVTPEAAVETLRTFRGLPHRTALVRTVNGVGYWNDSKGTNVDATLKSLEGFEDHKVHLILGGKDKGDDFARLGPLAVRKARRILAIGKAAPAIAQALGSLPAVVLEVVGTLEKAVEDAASNAEPGDAVLLSPACASFDQFRNFEHRGEVFESLVNALPERTAVGRH